MTTLEILKEISNENNGLILTKTATTKGVSRASLSQLCKDGKITRFEVETIWVRMEKEKKVY